MDRREIVEEILQAFNKHKDLRKEYCNLINNLLVEIGGKFEINKTYYQRDCPTEEYESDGDHITIHSVFAEDNKVLISLSDPYNPTLVSETYLADERFDIIFSILNILVEYYNEKSKN